MCCPACSHGDAGLPGVPAAYRGPGGQEVGPRAGGGRQGPPGLYPRLTLLSAA